MIMATMNPITKNEWLDTGIFSDVPEVPEDVALILYQSASRDMCKVYFLEDAVYKVEIRKLHFDRKAHVSLKTFTFDWSTKFPFSNSTTQYVDLAFNFTVSVKDKKEAIKTVFVNNITDISSVILEKLNQYGSLALSKEYSCLEASQLIAEVNRKISDLIERIDYLKITFNQTSATYDEISKKYIEDDIKDKFRKAEIDAQIKSLERDTELARALQKKSEIERIEDENAALSAKIKQEEALAEEAFKTELSAKEKAKERAVAKEEADNTTLKTHERQKLIKEYNIDDINAVDDSFGLQEKLEQQRDQNYENITKDFNSQLDMMNASKALLVGIDDAQMVEIIKRMFANTTMPQISSPQQKTNSINEEKSVCINVLNDDDIKSTTNVPPCIQIRKVDFSAVAPKNFVKGNRTIVNIVMYEKSFRHIVDELAERVDGSSQETRSGTHMVKQGSIVKVVLTSPDIVIDDNEEIQAWQGEYLNFIFAIFLSEQYPKQQILFNATVYINDIIATKLKFVAKCMSLQEQKITISREDVLSAFVSYASQDRSRVAAIVQGMRKARPDMDVFFDVDSLRSGEYWESILFQEIDKRDIFFLCWSHFARQSKWVDAEWRYALVQKGIDCIEPVPIEPPDVCPPPNELKSKHFSDNLIYVINADGGK